MPVRVFSEDEKKEIREKLLRVGFPLLKEYGILHMSIPKIAQAAHIGTGTFYRFFHSKEEYVYQLIQYRREKLLEKVITEEVRTGKRKLTKDNVTEIVRFIVDKDQSIYANMDLNDETELFEYMSEFSPNLEQEKRIARELMQYIDHPRKDIDYPVLANLMKILAFTAQARAELHDVGYERTISLLTDVIINQIFE